MGMWAAPGTTSSRAPAIPSASAWRSSTGTARSSAPPSTSVGAVIEASSGRRSIRSIAPHQSAYPAGSHEAIISRRRARPSGCAVAHSVVTQRRATRSATASIPERRTSAARCAHASGGPRRAEVQPTTSRSTRPGAWAASQMRAHPPDRDPAQGRACRIERVEQVDEVVPEVRDLVWPGDGRRATVAAQVESDNPVLATERLHERSPDRHGAPERVDEHDERPVRRAVLDPAEGRPTRRAPIGGAAGAPIRHRRRPSRGRPGGGRPTRSRHRRGGPPACAGGPRRSPNEGPDRHRSRRLRPRSRSG